MKDENGFYKDNSERLIRQIKDLKCELRKYEIEVENLADQKHQETFTFINNLPNKSIEKYSRESDNSNIYVDSKEGISFRNGNFNIFFQNNIFI